MASTAGPGPRPTGAGTLAGVGTPPGLQTDCETLLSRFQELDSVRFEDFAELWRSMKFATIFWWVCLAAGGDAAWVSWVRLAICLGSSAFPPPPYPTGTSAFRALAVLFPLNESKVRNKVTTPTLGPARMNSLSMQPPMQI